MSSHAEDEPQVVHMLAVDSEGESHDEEDEMLNHAEEIMLMHARESMGQNDIPPPLPDMDEAPLFVMPSHPDVDPLFIMPLNDESVLGEPLDDSFIFGLEDSTVDFAIRSENHVIPVINDDNLDDEPDESAEAASRLLQSQNGKSNSQHSSPGNIAHKGDDSCHSESENAQLSDQTSSQLVVEAIDSPLCASALEHVSPRIYDDMDGRHSAPVIPTLPSMEISTQSPAIPGGPIISEIPLPSESPAIPDGPILSETPLPSESSKALRVEGSSSRGFIWGMPKPVFFILAFYLLLVTVAFAYFASQYARIPSLEEEIDDLDTQVSMLKEENAQMEKVIANLNSTVHNLSAQVVNLTDQTDKLSASNLLLEEEIAEYESYLQSLGNGTVFPDTIANLTLENEQLNEDLLQLQIAYSALENLTGSLNETNAKLEEQVANLTSIVAELEGSC